jgi:hypothetical protein
LVWPIGLSLSSLVWNLLVLILGDKMRNYISRHTGIFLFLCASLLISPFASAITLEELAAKIDKMDAENQKLKKELQALKSGQIKVMKKQTVQEGKLRGELKEQKSIQREVIVKQSTEIGELRGELKELKSDQKKVMAKQDSLKETVSSLPGDFLNVSHQYTYDMLDPTRNINRKQLLLLRNRQNGKIKSNSLTFGAGVTAIANWQGSDTANKFGYLMRHPTSTNQLGKNTSEAALHSVQVGMTAAMGDWVTAYGEMLYDPQQSFGSGNNTALTRNQVQMRKGYVMFGNLDKFGGYFSVGKMATPFGLTDTVNPFTASTVWHAFGGLSYGALVGYSGHGVNFSFMGAQGGSQFRGMNANVKGTSTPSKLNNFVVDLNYTHKFAAVPFLGGANNKVLLGGSYERGSAYCQDFPVSHFANCQNVNPAYDVYGKLNVGDFTFIGEYARTLNKMPGSRNPDLPQFAAQEVTSWGVGGKYKTADPFINKPLFLSAEFSRFTAGHKGSPWQRQDQMVLGLASFVQPTVKIFAEYIRVDGYVPLNFLSGTSTGGATTHSVRGADGNIMMFGVQAAM